MSSAPCSALRFTQPSSVDYCQCDGAKKCQQKTKFLVREQFLLIDYYAEKSRQCYVAFRDANRYRYWRQCEGGSKKYPCNIIKDTYGNEESFVFVEMLNELVGAFMHYYVEGAYQRYEKAHEPVSYKEACLARRNANHEIGGSLKKRGESGESGAFLEPHSP